VKWPRRASVSPVFRSRASVSGCVRVISDRERLAAAIAKANHTCQDCGVPLGGPVLDENEWIPDSRHLRTCPALVGGSDSMIAAYLDVLDALHAAGYGADYGGSVPVFSSSAEVS
jgi:hypothetical protein